MWLISYCFNRLVGRVEEGGGNGRVRAGGAMRPFMLDLVVGVALEVSFVVALTIPETCSPTKEKLAQSVSAFQASDGNVERLYD